MYSNISSKHLRYQSEHVFKSVSAHVSLRGETLTTKLITGVLHCDHGVSSTQLVSWLNSTACSLSCMLHTRHCVSKKLPILYGVKPVKHQQFHAGNNCPWHTKPVKDIKLPNNMNILLTFMHDLTQNVVKYLKTWFYSTAKGFHLQFLDRQ